MANKVIEWVEAHPTESILIGGGGALALMWLLGFFGSSSSSSNSGASNMAAAYYAAEAQQAVVGGQIQMANINATRDTAIAGLETASNDTIAATQAGAAVTINGQNSDVSTALGVDQLNATYSNNATAATINGQNTTAATLINQSHDRANIATSWINSVLPIELSQNPNSAFTTSLPGGAGDFVYGRPLSPDMMRQAGYSDAAIAASGG